MNIKIGFWGIAILILVALITLSFAMWIIKLLSIAVLVAAGYWIINKAGEFFKK